MNQSWRIIIAGLSTPVLDGLDDYQILELADDRDGPWLSLSSGERNVIDMAVQVRRLERDFGGVDTQWQQRIAEATCRAVGR